MPPKPLRPLHEIEIEMMNLFLNNPHHGALLKFLEELRGYYANSRNSDGSLSLENIERNIKNILSNNPNNYERLSELFEELKGSYERGVKSQHEKLEYNQAVSAVSAVLKRKQQGSGGPERKRRRVVDEAFREGNLEFGKSYLASRGAANDDLRSQISRIASCYKDMRRFVSDDDIPHVAVNYLDMGQAVFAITNHCTILQSRIADLEAELKKASQKCQEVQEENSVLHLAIEDNRALVSNFGTDRHSLFAVCGLLTSTLNFSGLYNEEFEARNMFSF